MKTLSQIGLLLTVSCFASFVTANALQAIGVTAKLDKVSSCDEFTPVSGESYQWIKTDIDLASFLSGYSTMSPSTINEKSNQLCASQVDPAGFLHHISKARQCQLKVLSVSSVVKKSKVILRYSGCYLPSSQRVQSQPLVVVASSAQAVK